MEWFAIVPAAGLSRRMGRPKLLLELRGEPVVVRLLRVLAEVPGCRTVVTVRSGDRELIGVIRGTGLASLVIPEVDPPEMRESLQLGLEYVEREFRPGADAGYMLIPADHPVLNGRILKEMVAAWEKRRGEILVPSYRGRRGHPVLFSRRVAEMVATIPADRGFNWLLRENAKWVEEVVVEDEGVLLDLDTPEEWQRLREVWESSRDE